MFAAFPADNDFHVSKINRGTFPIIVKQELTGHESSSTVMTVAFLQKKQVKLKLRKQNFVTDPE